MSQLDNLLKEITKKHGDIVSQGPRIVEYERIRFTSPRLQYMTYGGLPTGRLYEFAGPESSGKTTTVLDVVKNAQIKFKGQENREIVYFDTEGTLDYVWAARLGVDVNNIKVVTPMTQSAEQVLTMVRDTIATGEVGLIILDSVATLVSEQLIGEDLDKKAYGGIAAALTRFSNEARGLLLKHNTTMVAINQVRENLNSTFGGTTTPRRKSIQTYV